MFIMPASRNDSTHLAKYLILSCFFSFIQSSLSYSSSMLLYSSLCVLKSRSMSRTMLTVHLASAPRAAPYVTTGRAHTRNRRFSLISCQNSRTNVSRIARGYGFSGAFFGIPGPSFKYSGRNIQILLSASIILRFDLCFPHQTDESFQDQSQRESYLLTEPAHGSEPGP